MTWRCDVEVMSRRGMKLGGVSAFTLLRRSCDLADLPDFCYFVGHHHFWRQFATFQWKTFIPCPVLLRLPSACARPCMFYKHFCDLECTLTRKLRKRRADLEVMSRPGMKLGGVSAFTLLRKSCDLDVRRRGDVLARDEIRGSVCIPPDEEKL